MKFKKVKNIYLFSKYTREDGEYTIESISRKINGHWKGIFVVTDRDGNEIDAFERLRDAKEAYKDR